MDRVMKRRLIAIVGLLLYLFDLGSDIFVAYKYWKNNHSYWFWITIVFITVPSIIVNVTSVTQLRNPWSCLASLLQLSLLVRYVKKIIRGLNPCTFAKLRYMQTIMESAPQCCLQAYFMLCQWSFPWYTVLSIVFSLLSLTWSITELEIIRQKNTTRGDLICVEKWTFLAWKLPALVSRFFAIVFFAYAFKYYVIIFLDFTCFSLHSRSV